MFLKTFIILLIIKLSDAGKNDTLTDRKTITSVFNKAKGIEGLEIDKWRAAHKKDILDRLSNLPESVKKALIKRAEAVNHEPWKSFRVSEYLEYVRNGNRINFETTNTQRRVKLTKLVIGELLTQNGTFLDQIADGVWLMLEESTWITPGHLKHTKAGDGLPDPEEQSIDLRPGEVSVTLSYVHLLLGKSLAKSFTPMFIKRVDYELERRIFEPYISNNFWWMGFNRSHTINNHNSWNNANVLQAALLALDNTSMRNALIKKLIKSLEMFVDVYPNDGGCDEGPQYWGWAGGKLIDALNVLTFASNGKMNWSDSFDSSCKCNLLDRMGSYLYKVHIDKNYFVNFADAYGQFMPPTAKVFMYGKLFNNPRMRQFASYLNSFEEHDKIILTVNDFLGSFFSFISELMTYEEIKSTKPKAPQPQRSWFPNRQVVTLRTNEGNASGLFFAAKGGHNDESHNHNDVGNFILYVNGKPAIIDVGVGQYTNLTFSKDRYKIWLMQSQWHNCPTINGVQQNRGLKFKASDVKFTENENQDDFQLDIGQAYPKDAKIKNWTRKYSFNRQKNELKLEENYSLRAWNESFRINFITNLEHTVDSNGKLILINNNKEKVLKIRYDTILFYVNLTKQATDPYLKKVWGDHVNRITLVERVKQDVSKRLKGRFTTTFSM